MALTPEEKQAQQESLAFDLTAAAQGVTVAELQEVLTRGTLFTYPDIQDTIPPRPWRIVRTFADVSAAAQAVGFSILQEAPGESEKVATIYVSSKESGPLTGSYTYRFTSLTPRPLLTWQNYIKTASATEKPIPSVLSGYFRQLAKLAGWLLDNDFAFLKIVGPAPGFTRQGEKAEPNVEPNAGDMLFFLGLLSRFGVAIPTVRVAAPIDGKVVAITPKVVTLDAETKGLYSLFSHALDKVARARKRRAEAEWELTKATYAPSEILLRGERTLHTLQKQMRALNERILALKPQVADTQAVRDARTKMRLAGLGPALSKQVWNAQTNTYEVVGGGGSGVTEAQRLLEAFKNRPEHLRLDARHQGLITLYKHMLQEETRLRRLLAQARLPKEAHRRVVQQTDADLRAAIPGLHYEAHLGYPSLQVGAADAEIKAALQALFAKPGTRVSVELARPAYTTQLVAFDPLEADELRELLQREKELVQIVAEQEPLLQQQDRAKDIVEATDGALAMMLRELRGEAVPVELEGEGIVTFEPSVLEAARKDVVQELYRVRARIRAISYERPIFHGRITLQVDVPRTRLSETLPLAPGIEVGVMVTRGQSLTGVPEIKLREIQAARPAVATVVPRAVRPRISTATAAALSNLGSDDPAYRIARLLPVGYAELRPGQVGVFALPQPEGPPADIYVTLLPKSPLTFADMVRAEGGIGNTLVAFGWMSKQTQESWDDAARAVANRLDVDADAARKLAAKIAGDDRELADWIQGRRALHVYAAARSPEALPGMEHATLESQIAPAHIDTSARVMPTSAAAGKSLPLKDIESITLYSLTQDRPVETAPVIFAQEVFSARTQGVQAALAGALNKAQEIISRGRAMGNHAKGLKKAEQAELLTAHDYQVAETRAHEFGTKMRDLEYVGERLLREKLEEATAAYPDLRQKVLQETAFKAPAATQLAMVLKAAEPAKYGNSTINAIVLSFTPEESEVQAGIAAIRERISEPRVTEDPFFDVLLVVDQKPDSSNRPRPSYELLFDSSTRSFRKGLSGAALGRMIEAFKYAPRVGWLPSQYPKTKAEKEALRVAAAARQLSQTSAVAAARLGLDFTTRGDIQVTKLQPYGAQRGMSVGGGIVVEAGRRLQSSAGYGMLTAPQRRSRREALLRRVPQHELHGVAAPVGRRGSYTEQLMDKARKLTDWKAKRLALAQAATAAPADLTSWLAGTDTLTPEGGELPALDLTMDLSALSESVGELDPDLAAFLKTNPRRRFLRANPLTKPVLAALSTLPGAVLPLLAEARGAVLSAAQGAAPTEDQYNALELLGRCFLAFRVYFAQVASGDVNVAFAKALVAAVFTQDHIDALWDFAPASVTVKDRVLASPETFVVDCLAGLGYTRTGAQLNPTSPAILLTFLLHGPAVAAYVATFPLTKAEETALAKATADTNQADVFLTAIQKARESPDFSRQLAKKGTRIEVVRQGLQLDDLSLPLLPETQHLRAPDPKVASLSELRKKLEVAYAYVLDALKDPGHIDTEGATDAVRNYESLLKSYQTKLQGAPLRDADFQAALAARLFQFLAGRVDSNQPAPSKERRLAALRGDLALSPEQRISLAGQLDLEGRPVFPIPAATFKQAGVPVPNYGDSYTLESRISIPQARRIVEATASRSTTPASTLDCKAGIGRGVAEFKRPYARYTPAGWHAKGIYNAIWLSPDAGIARLYRMGAPVCMFRRHPGETLGEFLGEVAENWHLWLTDPEKKRQASATGADIYLGQSGQDTVYRIHKTDERPLTRINLARRLSAAGVVLTPKGLQGKAKAPGALTWADPATVSADAETYLRALQENNLLPEDVAEEAMALIEKATGARPTRAPTPTYSTAGGDSKMPVTLLFAPPAAGNTVAPEMASVLSPVLLSFADTTFHAYDPAFTNRVRTVATKLLTGQFDAREAAQAASVLGSSGLAVLLARLQQSQNQANPTVNVVAGAMPDLEAAQKKLTKETDGDIQFDARAARSSPAETTRLLELALAGMHPIIIVEGEDRPLDNVTIGLKMLTAAVQFLQSKNRLDVPIVYLYPDVFAEGRLRVPSKNAKGQTVYTSRDVQGAVVQIAMAAAPGSSLIIGTETFSNAAALLSHTLVRANPRQRAVRQVAATWQRTLPF